MTWKDRGCYVWRTDKPHALLGISLRWMMAAAVALATVLYSTDGPWALAFILLFFSGRHTAYVGQTGNRYFRDRQHLRGDQRYGAIGKPWADLNPRVYALPCLLSGWKWSREFSEKLWIFLLLPVYNVTWNRKNPRRIKPKEADEQRGARERARRSVEGWTVRAFVMTVRITIAAIFWAGIVAYMYWKKG